MKVGVICRFEKEFKEFELANPVFECVWIHSKLSLTFTTVDFFVRLKGWEKASPRMLRAVASIESLRGIKRVKAKVKIEQQKPTWSLNGNPVGFIQSGQVIFDDRLLHPNGRCVISPQESENIKATHEKLSLSLSGGYLRQAIANASDSIDALAGSFAMLKQNGIFIKSKDDEIGGLP